MSRAEGDDLTARRLYEESLAIGRETGSTQGIGAALRWLGNLELDQGDYQVARTHLEESITLYRREGDRPGIAMCLEGLAGVAAGQGDAVRAARLWGAAEALRAALGMPQTRAERAKFPPMVAAAQAQVAPAAWAQAWAEGRAMPLEQTISSTLERGDPAG